MRFNLKASCGISMLQKVAAASESFIAFWCLHLPGTISVLEGISGCLYLIKYNVYDT
jgi:hypothetical protein